MKNFSTQLLLKNGLHLPKVEDSQTPPQIQELLPSPRECGPLPVAWRGVNIHMQKPPSPV